MTATRFIAGSRQASALAVSRRRCLGIAVISSLDENLLKGVSRSFYLSLRLLPTAMRPAASIAYLLARTSDTLADSQAAALATRKWALAEFEKALLAGEKAPAWPDALRHAPTDLRERLLLANTARILATLHQLPALQAQLVRDVCKVIISGQALDLERFSAASSAAPIALPDDAALDDYTWRVAGCVGEFWTKLGFLTMGKCYSSESEARLLEQGRLYGKGLQLVNILRDLGPDIAAGRCYLPVIPSSSDEFLNSYHQWFQRAQEWTSQGKLYAAALHTRRLRTATVLPALLAEKTLLKLGDPQFPLPRTGVKISRTQVYRSLIRAVILDGK